MSGPTVLACTRTCWSQWFFVARGQKCKEKDYEVQNDGGDGIGWGVCCGHGGGDGVGRGDGYGGDKDAGDGGAGAAVDRGEGHQPENNGRGHRFAAARFAGEENGGNWGEFVACGCGGGKVLADLLPLREGRA